MSDYSGYQIKRAHSLGPFSSVYEATAPNGGPGRFALKVFHPPASGSIRRAYAIEGWLLAAERQQKAAKKDGAVLEIVAFGRCPEGAYCVMPWQDRPFEPLMQNLAAKGDLLRATAESLLNALEQWGAQTGGSHRKLKPSNIFLTKSGPMLGTPVVLSDPWFLLGIKDEKARINDLMAVGAILAQIVRRREVAAWPIEDAPEWKALGRPGKAWLAYVNFLLDPKPATGELTIAEARRRLAAVPKDANPARTALFVGTGALALGAAAVLLFARFGNPIYMPERIKDLANTLGNPDAQVKEVPRQWADLCVAWDTWLVDLQNNGRRLLRVEGLWEPNDPLRREIENFVATANELRPEILVPSAANEKRLGVLAKDPPEAVLKELLTPSVQDRVKDAGGRLVSLQLALVSWPKWDQLRGLQKILEERGFARAAASLGPKLPQARNTPGYRLDLPRTLKLFNDISLDTTGTLPLAGRWGEITKLSEDMKGTTDRVQQAMPDLILARLVDRGSLGDFADSLVGPLDEMKLRRKMFLDPQVVTPRFLGESELLKETAAVTVDDFPRWEEQLALFSKVPAAEDPRLKVTLDDSLRTMGGFANDLEADAPAPEAGGPPTLNRADFERQLQQRTEDLAALRAKVSVRADLPLITQETDKMAVRLTDLRASLDATLAMLNPQKWLDKVGLAYGKFNETKQRWAAWQATLNGVTAASLDGRTNPANRARFRELRAQERQVREWIDGLEGPDGLGALVVPDLAAVSADSAGPLRELEAARREQTAVAAAGAAEWRAALPVLAWSAAPAAVRAPLEAHRVWLADLPDFGADLDRLGGLLTGGFSWNEGVSEVLVRLTRRAGLDVLTGRPAEWNTEARLLGRLVESTDRAALAEAAQSGGLSRKLTAWRRLGAITGWPAGAADLDIDGGVVAALREIVGRDVPDEARRVSLLEELTRETRVRWNRAARNSAANIEQMTAVFERMAKYGIGEGDLEAPALYNLKLWQLKRSDWSEVDLAPLRARRDAFVAAVRAIADVPAQPAVASFVRDLDGIELVIDPNRKPTPSPRLAGWTEELTDAGLGLTATWNRGGKTVKLDFAIVQPPDDTPPFYLARRVLAVGEFLDLFATRPQEDVAAVLAELPLWTRSAKAAKPYDIPMAWRPRIDDRTGNYEGFELNPEWFYATTAAIKGLIDTLKDSPEARAQNPDLNQALNSDQEKPTLRSPLQYVPPDAARVIAEKMLGARLPTVREWEAVMKVVGTPPAGNFRGPNFQRLFKYLREYNVAGQRLTWRPSDGAFRPKVPTPGGLPKTYEDDGQAGPDPDDKRLWFAPVEEGPATGGFVNLTGNVSIYLYDTAGKNSYVAGGSALSPPGIDFTQPQKVEGSALIGGKSGKDPYTDVGIRPAFDAPPGFKERYKLLVLVRQQGFLTW
jgi:hypothetical protein